MKKTLLFFALLGMVVFASCDKEGWKEDDYDKDDWEKDKWDEEDKACFDLVYPVSYEMPDGSIILVDDEESLWSDIKAWYEAHPDVEAKPSLQYPVSVVFEDNDQPVDVTNEDEMIDLKKDCEWDEEWECFELVFPVIFTMPDGSTITGNDEEEVWTAIKAWYDVHPDVEAEPALQYPVSVVFEDNDQPIDVANEDEMEGLKEECEDEDECFELVFPVSFTMPDGSTITGNDEESLWTDIEAWYDAHPDAAAEPDLQYPVDILFEDGTTQMINNESEMETAEESCED